MMVGCDEMVKFIRCVSRIHLRESDKDIIADFLNKEVPWEHLVPLAELDGVAGLMYHHLIHPCLGEPPKPTLKQLENITLKNTKHSLAIIVAARALSARLAQVGTPVVALQGLSLIRLYKDPRLRPLWDVDLMVRHRDREGLKKLLLEAGYRVQISAYPDLLSRDGVWVDIHTHILNLERIQTREYIFPRDLTPMWQRAVPLFDESSGLLTLGPFDNFIALAAHALKHGYSRLNWLVDLHESLLELAVKPDGWEELLKRTRFWHQERIVLYALILVERIFDMKIPTRVKGDLGIHGLSILEKHLIRLRVRGFSSPMLCNGLWVANVKGIGNKLRFIKETLLPRGEVMDQIRHDGAWGTEGPVYAKRLADAAITVWKDLHRAVGFSFWTGGNG